MPTDSIGSLVDILRQYRLLEAEQLKELPRLQQHFPDPRHLAKELVRRGWLTPFQANQLATGNLKNLVLGPYLLLEKIGEGGMGQVFKARHQRLGRIDSVKVIRKERLAKHEAVKRFYREMRAAAQLRHPNIVHAYDADEVEGTHYFSMEYVEGIDLAAYVKKHGPLPVAEACEYVRQTALGLQHAFERGLVHRDIKPQNLLVTGGLVTGGLVKPEGSSHHSPLTTHSPAGAAAPTHQATRYQAPGAIKILDMGLARIEVATDDSSTVTREGTVMGTPDYIAPEQARSSHEVDIRADIYSLGCTFYFLLTGKPPFPGGSLTEKLLKHQLEEPQAIEQRRPDVPAEVSAILRGMMAKDPEQRFQTPAQVVAALALLSRPSSAAPAQTTAPAPDPLSTSLEDALASTPPESQPDTLPLVERLRKKRLARQKAWEKRILAGACAVGALVLFVLLALVVSQFFGGKPEEQESTPEAATTDEKPRPRRRDRTPSKEELAAAERKRTLDAEQALAPIAAEAARPGADLKKVHRELQLFLMQHSATPAAAKASELLGKILVRLPSQLDQLDSKKLPSECTNHWKTIDWEPPTELVAVLGEHRRRHWGGGRCLAGSADGKVLATAGADNTVRVWDASDWRQRLILPINWTVEFLALNSDGSLLAIGGQVSGGAPQLWDVAKRTLVRTLESDLAQAAFCGTFSPDGKFLLTGRNDSDKGTLQLWDVETGREVQRLTVDSQAATHALAFLPARQRAVSAHADGKLRLWNLDTGTCLTQYAGHAGPITWISASPDGTKVLSAAPTDKEASLRLWNLESGQGTNVFQGSVSYAVFSPDGSRAITSGDGAGFIRVHDLRGGQLLREMGAGLHHSRCGLANLSDEGRLVSLTDSGQLRIWDLESGKEVSPLLGHSGPLNTVDFSSDERFLLSAGIDGAARLWQVKTGTESGRVPCHSAWFVPGSTACIGIGTDGVARSFDPKQQVRREYERTFAVAASPNGYTGLFIDLDGLIKVWDLEAGKDLRRFGADGRTALPRYLAISPDARRALSGDEKTIRLWDLEKGRELLQFEAIAVPEQGSIAFAPDGLTALIGSGTSVLTFRLDTGELERRFEGNAANVTRALFSPDGAIVASAALDGRVLLWSAASGVQLHEWKLPGPVHSLAFAPDGRHLASANANGTVYLLRIVPPKSPK